MLKTYKSGTLVFVVLCLLKQKLSECLQTERILLYGSKSMEFFGCSGTFDYERNIRKCVQVSQIIVQDS